MPWPVTSGGSSFLQGGLFVVLGLATLFDVIHRRIPNWLVLGGIVFFLVLELYSDSRLSLSSHLLGAVLGLVVFFPFYLRRGMGAGDVKLMGVVGLYLGPWGTLFSALLVALSGGVLALLCALLGQTQRLPYAVAITAGVLMYLLWFREHPLNPIFKSLGSARHALA